MTAVFHLTASTFHGGPERQMLGLARSLAPGVRTVFLSFSEGGRCRDFLEQAHARGFEAHALGNDTPRLLAAADELSRRLRAARPEALLMHGYKAGLIGRIAARRAGVPAVAVSRGWTYESPKVRLYEAMDRFNLRLMDRVVCVSRGQAAKVRRAGVPERKILVIPNAVDVERFAATDPAARGELQALFPASVRRIVGAAGRLSPEKGFADLVDAAARVAAREPDVGFAIFGEGVLRESLGARISAAGLDGRFILAGFRPDLDRLAPHLDLFVQSSWTEGMPNVVLEACAAGVPVVATAVGGTPEILDEAEGDLLVPPGVPAALAGKILHALGQAEARRDVVERARRRMIREFSFAAQAERYLRLFEDLAAPDPVRGSTGRQADATAARVGGPAYGGRAS
ncbi:glycosyltransferase [Paludisphaera soli]|uniref:glycosyltransferase n=1 Tax=Paludisphaera soli TaxID=2712865 RepID=UPI0013EBE5B5|nr:glycosyltransferase [Paludisphaera soli]